MLQSILIYCGDTDTWKAHLQANIRLPVLHTGIWLAVSSAHRYFDGAGDLGGWALPSRAFKGAATSSSISPCLTSQATVLYRQGNHRSTLGQTDNPDLIFLILPCLPSSYSKIYTPPPILSLWGHEGFIFYSLSSLPCGFEFPQTHSLCASCQPLSKIMMITFEEKICCMSGPTFLFY